MRHLSTTRPRKRGPDARACYRPQLEPLEDRLVLSDAMLGKVLPESNFGDRGTASPQLVQAGNDADCGCAFNGFVVEPVFAAATPYTPLIDLPFQFAVSAASCSPGPGQYCAPVAAPPGGISVFYLINGTITDPALCLGSASFDPLAVDVSNYTAGSNSVTLGPSLIIHSNWGPVTYLIPHPAILDGAAGIITATIYLDSPPLSEQLNGPPCQPPASYQLVLTFVGVEFVRGGNGEPGRARFGADASGGGITTNGVQPGEYEFIDPPI